MGCYFRKSTYLSPAQSLMETARDRRGYGLLDLRLPAGEAGSPSRLRTYQTGIGMDNPLVYPTAESVPQRDWLGN